MFNACGVLRSCSVRVKIQLTSKNSTFIPGHVQHAFSSRRATTPPAKSGTTTARLRPDESKERVGNSTSATPRLSLVSKNVCRPPVSQSETARKIHRGKTLNTARKHHSKDPLFGQLYNPRGTRTVPRQQLDEKSTLENQKAKKKSHRKPLKPSFYRVIRAASVENIEYKLYFTAKNIPNLAGVRFMLRELIEVRHIQPETRHYDALILANREARHGSADALYPILAEMEREKVGIGASTLSAVLELLSIHPDAQLLTSIIHTFSTQWADTTIADKINVILILSRLNQFEFALTHLEHLISTSPPPTNYLESPIPKYLYTTIVYRLASSSVSDHTATLHLLYLLTDNNLPISNTCISYILDCAAEALHLDLTLYLWRSHVDTNYIVPSTGLCRNALLTAARSTNSELATKAGRVLERRGYENGGIGLQIEELEMVREAFSGDRDRNVGFQAVNRVEKRMLELRKMEMEETKTEIEREREPLGWKHVELLDEMQERAGMEEEK